ncbi:MAG: flagellar hook-associated protein FlgL [Myxococcota bacterium]|nr:flagellar hook-associated protein FlgL [Myxococcota bacterium]
MTRITGSMTYRTALQNLAVRREQLARTEEQATSGRRINRPSDDPVGAGRAARLRLDVATSDQFLRNASAASARLRATEQAVKGAHELVSRARALAVQGATDTLDASARRILATDVESLHADLLALANARHDGGSLFAGMQNDGPAFSASGGFAAAPPTVTYQGDSAELEVEVEPGSRIATTLDGRRVFQGDADGDGAPDGGREDAFRVLGDLWQALVDDDRAAVAATLDRLDTVELQIELEQTRVGAADRRVQNAAANLGDTGVELRQRLSEVEDADTIRVLSELALHQAALEASLRATASVVQNSLVSFLS